MDYYRAQERRLGHRDAYALERMAQTEAED